LPQVLLHHGFFLTSPSQPCMAVLVELLAFYLSLFERSCDAVNVLVSALNSHYVCRGYHMTSHEVCFTVSSVLHSHYICTNLSLRESLSKTISGVV
ncbi:hypothetical protein EDD17DRAFT_1500371, partial [Pisolithus thermaeus]